MRSPPGSACDDLDLGGPWTEFLGPRRSFRLNPATGRPITLAESRRPKESPMTTIKATCGGCGEVDLVADDILLRIGATKAVNTYGFTCPQCREFVEKPADERIVRLLLSGGVIPVPVHVPAEVLEVHDGPPITYDDVLDFHEQLRTDDWFDELVGRGTV